MPAAPMLPTERVLIERLRANPGRRAEHDPLRVAHGQRFVPAACAAHRGGTGERCPVLLSNTVKTRDREKWLRTGSWGGARVARESGLCRNRAERLDLVLTRDLVRAAGLQREHASSGDEPCSPPRTAA